MTLKSKIYWGEVWHKRRHPKDFTFKYPTFCCAIELSEEKKFAKFWPFFAFNRFALWRINNQDYLGSDALPIKEKYLAYFQKNSEQNPPEQVFLLTIPRLLGYVFNPVNFYLGYSNGILQSCLAEVNNTFNETHYYFMEQDATLKQSNFTASFSKKFYVSPFYDRSGKYKVTVRDFAEKLDLVVDLFDVGELTFSAGLNGKGKEFTFSNLLISQLRFPLTALLVMCRIHWQAFKLFFIVKAPLFMKPEPLAESTFKPRGIFHSLRLVLIRNLLIIQKLMRSKS